jgi:predicted O-methyltransferase YrrM
VFIQGTSVINDVEKKISVQYNNFEKYRKSANYNTGSISYSSSIVISLLTYYFQPKIIAEVGTFIGRSTFSLAIGSEQIQNNQIEIHTCDLSNEITLNLPCSSPIKQYPKMSSTQMFSELIKQKIKPDLYFLDGRLAPQDLDLLVKMNAENSLIILDDFEGTEKGVMNALFLTQTFNNNFLLSYPPQPKFLNKFGLKDYSTIAVLIPMNKINFVNQV